MQLTPDWARPHHLVWSPDTHTDTYTAAHIRTSIHFMLLSTCSTLGTYGIGYTLNKLTLGFLFYGDKVTVISVYYFSNLHAFCFRDYLV